MTVDRPTALRNRFEPMPTHELESYLIEPSRFSNEKKGVIRTILHERSLKDKVAEKAADEARQQLKIQLDIDRNRIAEDGVAEAKKANGRSTWALWLAALALLVSIANAVGPWIFPPGH